MFTSYYPPSTLDEKHPQDREFGFPICLDPGTGDQLDSELGGCPAAPVLSAAPSPRARWGCRLSGSERFGSRAGLRLGLQGAAPQAHAAPLAQASYSCCPGPPAAAEGPCCHAPALCCCGGHPSLRTGPSQAQGSWAPGRSGLVVSRPISLSK